MALTFNKATDSKHTIKLESELLYAGWKSGAVHAGAPAAFDVKTAFVGNGSPVEVTGKTKEGKKLGKVKGAVVGNSFAGALDIPDNVAEGDWAYFEVSLTKCGLKGEADPVPVLPPISISGMKWSAQEARRGDVVTLSADVKGVRDDTPVKIVIFEYDRDGVHDKVVELPAAAKDQKISLDWKYEYFEDTDEIPTEDEMKKYGKHYNPPEYFFVVEIEGVRAGQKQESGLLRFKDHISIQLVAMPDFPLADTDFTLRLADGREFKGKTDSNGYANLDDVPPGSATITIEGIDEIFLVEPD